MDKDIRVDSITSQIGRNFNPETSNFSKTDLVFGMIGKRIIPNHTFFLRRVLSIFLAALLIKNKAVEDSRLLPGACCAAADWCRHLAKSTKHNTV